jgi:hypothetical protein
VSALSTTRFTSIPAALNSATAFSKFWIICVRHSLPTKLFDTPIVNGPSHSCWAATGWAARPPKTNTDEKTIAKTVNR